MHPPTPDELVAALEHRAATVIDRSEALSAEFAEQNRKLDQLRLQMKELEEEREQIMSLLARYRANFQLTSVPPKAAEKPGPTEAIKALLKSQPGFRMDLGALLGRMEREIAGGGVQTSTTNPRKLVASVIKQMMKGQQVMKTRNTVYLIPDDTGQPKRRTARTPSANDPSEPSSRGGD